MDRTRTALGIVVFFALCAPWPAAQDVPAAGFERDSDYAQRLAERGFREAATWKVGELKKATSLTAEQKVAVTFLEASLAVTAFDLEKDFQKALAQQASAKKGLEDYLKAAPKGVNASKARYLLGDLGRKLGQKIVEQIRKETGGAEKVAELRKMGDEAFKAAEDYFRQRRSELEPIAREKEKTSPEFMDFIRACYAVPDTQLSHASLYSETDEKRKRLLELASAGFEDFSLECEPEFVVYFEAMVKWGNANRELGKIDKAIECYGQALASLYEGDVTTERVVVPPDFLGPNEKYVILEAATESARLYNKVKKPAEVIHIVGDVRKAILDLDQFERGPALLYELAHAHELDNRSDRAVEEARKGLRMRPSEKIYDDLVALLERNGIASNNEMTLDQVAGPIARAIQDKNPTEAIRQYHRSLLRVRGSNAEKFLPDILLLGGFAYNAVPNRALEAILLWETMADTYPDHKMAVDALGQASLAASRLFSTTKAPWAEKRARELRDKTQERHPDTAAAQGANTAYIKAVQTAGGKSQDEIRKLLLEDIKRLAKTEAAYGDKSYDLALNFYNDALSKKGAEKDSLRKSAEEWFKNYVDWANAQNALETTAAARIEEKRLNAQILPGRMWLWDPNANPEKSLTIVRGIEERVAKLGGTKRQEDLEEIKLQAYLKSGKLEAATQVLEGFLAKTPDAGVTVRSAKRISDHVNNELRSKTLDPARAPALVEAGLRYTRVWIDSGAKQEGRIDANDFDQAAARVLNLGLQKNGIEKFPGSFMEIDQSKLAYKEPIQFAADTFGKAIAANEAAPEGQFNVTLVRFKRAQALGLLGRFDELEGEYRRISEANTMLTPAKVEGEYVVALAPEVRGFGYQLLNEWSFALADKARRGDKKSGVEAMRISGAVIKATDPGGSEGSKDWWFARYLNLLSAEALGQYATAEATLDSYLATDKELDKDKYGFKTRILALRERVKGRPNAALSQTTAPPEKAPPANAPPAGGKNAPTDASTPPNPPGAGATKPKPPAAPTNPKK